MVSVPAVERAIRIMRCVAEKPGQHTTGNLARSLQIAPASSFRIVATLMNARWLTSQPGGGLMVGTGLLPIVEALSPYRRLIDVSDPVLTELCATTELSAKLSIREGSEQLTLSRAESPRPLSVTGKPGARYPVVQGAAGAALLASLEEDAFEKVIAAASPQAWDVGAADHFREMWLAVRQDGVCANIGVHPQGIEAVSAPIRNEDKAVIAAITLIGLRGDFGPDRLPELKQAVRSAARRVEKSLTKAAQAKAPHATR